MKNIVLGMNSCRRSGQLFWLYVESVARSHGYIKTPKPKKRERPARLENEEEHKGINIGDGIQVVVVGRSPSIAVATSEGPASVSGRWQQSTSYSSRVGRKLYSSMLIQIILIVSLLYLYPIRYLINQAKWLRFIILWL